MDWLSNSGETAWIVLAAQNLACGAQRGKMHDTFQVDRDATVSQMNAEILAQSETTFVLYIY